jgi:hypothetical protein
MASIVLGDSAARTGAMNPKFPETAIRVVPTIVIRNPANPSRPDLTGPVERWEVEQDQQKRQMYRT